MTKIQARQLAYSIVRGVVRNFVDDGMVRRELAYELKYDPSDDEINAVMDEIAKIVKGWG